MVLNKLILNAVVLKHQRKNTKNICCLRRVQILNNFATKYFLDYKLLNYIVTWPACPFENPLTSFGKNNKIKMATIFAKVLQQHISCLITGKRTTQKQEKGLLKNRKKDYSKTGEIVWCGRFTE